MKKLRQRTLMSAILSTATTCGVAMQITTGAANAQFDPSQFRVNGYQNGSTDYATRTYRDPYVPGVMLTPPLSAPVVQPPSPAPGSGALPPGVTPGQAGPAPIVPSNFYPPDEPLNMNGNNSQPPADMQLFVSPRDRSQLTSQLQGYLTPPPSAPGPRPSSLIPPDQASASALSVPVYANAPLTDQGMPTTRSGYQSTQDFGIHKTNSSYNSDFGVRPVNNNPYNSVNQTQVGIRMETYPGVMGQVNNTAPNIPGAFKVIAGGANDAVPGTGARTSFPTNGGTWMGTNYGSSLSPSNGYISTNPQFNPISYTPPNQNTQLGGGGQDVVQTPPSGSFYQGDDATSFQEGSDAPKNFQPYDSSGQ